MLSFHVLVHGREGTQSAPLQTTFDSAYAALEALPRMFIEPDGSFVWAGREEDGREWQVDGNLIDRGDRLAYVELKGCCPAERFDQLLQCIGWPAQPVRFQLPSEGIWLDERLFRERHRPR